MRRNQNVDIGTVLGGVGYVVGKVVEEVLVRRGVAWN